MDLLSEQVATKVAELLLQVKAVKLSLKEPFTWASGWKSPIYCDNRVTLSYPKIRNFIRHELANAVTEKFGQPDVIAGVATGAIAQGALVAQELDLPFVYVRSKAKEHGLSNQVEGYLEKGQQVVVIEDLISTGKSSLNAVKALREAGAHVKGMAAIFTYGFDEANQNFDAANCKAVTLSNYEMLIKAASEGSQIKESDKENLQAWREDPGSWGK